MFILRLFSCLVLVIIKICVFCLLVESFSFVLFNINVGMKGSFNDFEDLLWFWILLKILIIRFSWVVIEFVDLIILFLVFFGII